MMFVSSQYFLYLLVGAFYYALLSAVAAGGAGLMAGTAIPIIAALFMGGFGPGLSLVAPRWSAWWIGALSVFFIGYVILVVILDPSDVYALIAAIPSVGTLAVALVGARRGRAAVFSADRGVGVRVVLGLAAALPALVAIWLILGIVVRL